MTRLRRAVAVLSCAALLSACGAESDMDPATRILMLVGKAATSRVVGSRGKAEPQPSDMELRQMFQEAGQPILQLDVDTTGAVAYLAPVAVSGGVTTWVSNDRVNLSTRDGVIQATRGLGSDLMSASVPTAAQLFRGAGTHQRLHVYLDGADRTQKFSFTCTVADAGPQDITVLGLLYTTRHITETCAGDSGTETNHYWFDGGVIRQSVQFLVPGGDNLTVRAIID